MQLNATKRKNAPQSTYTFASDYADKKAPVEYVYKNEKYGITAPYRSDTEKNYKKKFKDSEEAVKFIHENPPNFSVRQKNVLNDSIDKLSEHLSDTYIYNARFPKDTINEINSNAECKVSISSGTVQQTEPSKYYTQQDDSLVNDVFKSVRKNYTILSVAQVDENVMKDPFHYKGKAMRDILVKKSITIQEIMYCFQPMSIIPFESREPITGEAILTMFKSAGIDNYKNVKDRTSSIFVAHCKLEEPYEIFESEDEANRHAPLLDRLKESEERAKSHKMSVDSFPIVQEMIKEFQLDINNSEDIELAVQTKMELKILLKEINEDRNRIDEKLEKRKFTFICYFFV